MNIKTVKVIQPICIPLGTPGSHPCIFINSWSLLPSTGRVKPTFSKARMMILGFFSISFQAFPGFPARLFCVSFLLLFHSSSSAKCLFKWQTKFKLFIDELMPVCITMRLLFHKTLETDFALITLVVYHLGRFSKIDKILWVSKRTETPR